MNAHDMPPLSPLVAEQSFEITLAAEGWWRPDQCHSIEGREARFGFYN
jgi:hypothetical protein